MTTLKDLPERTDAEPWELPADFPREIWICGTRCTIKPGNQLDCIGSHAYIKLDMCEIVFNPHCHKDYMREVLLHEVIHGIDKLTNEPPALTEARHRIVDDKGLRLEEREVLAFSRGLYMTLTDPRNKAAVDWILG